MTQACYRDCDLQNNPPYGSNNCTYSNCSYYEAAESGLAGAMASRWIAFAGTGDPNNRSLAGDDEPAWSGCPATARASAAAWPSYDAGKDLTLRLAMCDLSTEVSAGRGYECDFWDQFPDILP